MANKYLFADLLLFENGEGDEATLPSFVAENKLIDASSPSLKAPIATCHMPGGMRMGAANKYLFANVLFHTTREDDEATSLSMVVENVGN